MMSSSQQWFSDNLPGMRTEDVAVINKTATLLAGRGCKITPDLRERVRENYIPGMSAHDVVETLDEYGII